MGQASEEQIALLQREVRAVGHGPPRLVAAILLAPMLLAGLLWGLLYRLVPFWAGAVLLVAATGVGVVAAALLGRPLTLVYRNNCRRRLRGSLAALPPEQVLAVLRPLRAEAGETGLMAQDLGHDLRLERELAPADPPTGGGDAAGARE
jgi:hypothetical protein